MNERRRIIGISGWKNSGKTRMTAALVAELTARGRVVSTVKHAHHAFDIDHEGTDSHAHRQAGAREVAIVSGRRWALMHELGPDEAEPPLDEILSRLGPCDLVIVEGFKREAHPKIEMRRIQAASRDRLAGDAANIVAIVSDDPADTDDSLPVFGHDAVAAIADFIERCTGLKRP
ncbi:MAG: molybdopterin-guanine dinucleotide biosynthesis protein B [Oricola sp.]